MTKTADGCKESPDADTDVVDDDDDVDQILDAIGNWGRWQTKMFFTAGIFLIPGTFHILVLTFINASQVIKYIQLQMRFNEKPSVLGGSTCPG